MATMTIAKAITEGLRAALANNPKSLLMGEDIGTLGGVYRVTDGLHGRIRRRPRGRHPAGRVRHHRHRDRPGLRGYRPICEIQFDGFVFPGFNQITTQLAKMRARSDGS